MVQETVNDLFIIGLIGGLLGLFYRNCLKVEGMIFNSIYYRWLKPWAEGPEDIEEAGFKPKSWDKIKAFVAMPLGYCMYCSATWITFLLSALYLSSYDILPMWQDIVIGVIAASVTQHLVVCIACRFLIHKHPDLG